MSTTRDSPLLNLPREIRDTPPVISSTVITNGQPFHIKSSSNSQARLFSRPNTTGLPSTCKQIQSEYSHLLHRAAFKPGTRTVTAIYNFDFSDLISFIKSLKPHEIDAVNRNGNITADLFVSAIGKAEAQRLLEWLRVAEETGIGINYVVAWNSFDMKNFKALEAVVRATGEGRKIMKVLGGRSVGSWSWEAYQQGLKGKGRC